jgi:prepilin-type N-terminal cleavage/methylation domain-containing protein
MGEDKRGFSLIELLIVVAIILIIAAIAIPNLIRAKISANQASAVASLRTIVSAQFSYSSVYPGIGYAPSLLALGTGAVNTTCPGASSAHACMVDEAITSANGAGGLPKSGYVFTSVGSTVAGTVNDLFESEAGPAIVGRGGISAFCAVENAVIRQNPNNTNPGLPGLSHDNCDTSTTFLPLNN